MEGVSLRVPFSNEMVRYSTFWYDTSNSIDTSILMVSMVFNPTNFYAVLTSAALFIPVLTELGVQNIDWVLITFPERGQQKLSLDDMKPLWEKMADLLKQDKVRQLSCGGHFWLLAFRFLHVGNFYMCTTFFLWANFICGKLITFTYVQSEINHFS